MLVEGGAVIEGSNTESHIEIVKPLVFNGEIGKVGSFIIACRLYLRIRMREAIVKEQVQWILLYVVRHSSHWGGSLQNGLEDEQTCGTTLASAYVLRHLSATWSQLQMKERKSK